MPVTLGKGVLPAIPSNSKGVIVAGAQLFGSGIPSDALGNLGDRYLDTATGRWYLKRWVGNGTSGDKVSLAKNVIAAAGDFSVSMLLYGPSNAASYPLLIDGGVTKSLVVDIRPGGIIGFARKNTADIGAGLASQQSWQRFSASRSGGNLIVSIGASSATIADPGGYIDSVSFAVGASGGSTISGTMMLCNVAATGNGNTLAWPLDDGSGGTARDTSGNGNAGTLSDVAPATFWLQTWVPLDLLT